MALNCEIKLPIGVFLTYHKVKMVQVDYVTGQGYAHYNSYLSINERQGNVNACDTKVVNFNIDVANPPTGDIRAAVYEAMKKLPEFAGATDI